MKKIVLSTLLIIAFTGKMFAQKQHSIGVYMNAEMGLMYGIATNSNWMYKYGGTRGALRVRLNRTNLGWQNYSGQNYLYFNSGLFLGYEFRKPFNANQKFAFYHGPEFGTAYYRSAGASNYSNFAPSIRYFLGLRYRVNSHFEMGYEAPSTLSSNFYKQDGVWNPNRQINAGFLNESGYLTLLYNFAPKKASKAAEVH